MLLSRAVRRLGGRGWLAPAVAKRFARWMSHIEHAGGTVVGVECFAPHYFSWLALAGFALVVIIGRSWAALEE